MPRHALAVFLHDIAHVDAIGAAITGSTHREFSELAVCAICGRSSLPDLTGICYVRGEMKRNLTIAAMAVAGLAFAGPAVGYDVTSIVSPAGMQVEAWIEGDNRVVIGLTAPDGIKLTGQLGVAISSMASDPWAEELPLVVTRDGDYFEFPFSETVSFDPAQLNEPSTLSVEYGTCQLAAAICIFEETEVVIHPDNDGAHRVTLTNVIP